MAYETYSDRAKLKFALSRLRGGLREEADEAVVLALMAKVMGSVLVPGEKQHINRLGNVQGAAPLLESFQAALAGDQGKADDFVEFVARLLELDFINISETKETKFLAEFTPAVGEDPKPWPDNWDRIQRMADEICNPQGEWDVIDENSMSAAVYLLGEPKEQEKMLATKVLENRLVVFGRMRNNPVEVWNTAVGETAAYLGEIDTTAYRYFVDVCRAADTDSVKRAAFFQDSAGRIKTAIFTAAAPFCLYTERLNHAMNMVEYAYGRALPGPGEFQKGTQVVGKFNTKKAAAFADAVENTYLSDI